MKPAIERWLDNVTDKDRVTYETIAHRCARGIRGCATDEQYCDLLDRMVEAFAYVACATRRDQPVDETKVNL